ncbi:MAG: beta-lactamase family protein [Treponema sp.]|jgi:CubicO group peptidase (beta-lactamase class C family)|nr:beta-lactamase family protein [Treponema sp.]
MDITSYAEVIEKRNLKVEGIVLFKGGERVAERRWVPEKPRPVYSVSKSFTAIAAGLAIAEGKLSLMDRVADAFPGPSSPFCGTSQKSPLSGPKPCKLPAAPSPRLASLTLEHLLTMSRGHGGFSRPRTVADALEQTLDFDPGTRFVYDNGSTLLASAMITRATGQKVRDYLLDRLFRPLGIPDPVWKESGDGCTLGATGLELTTGDLAAFGQLLLQRGSWKGKQLVPAAWIDGASRPHISTKETGKPDYDVGYGYGFWACRHGAYRADGKNGQFVIVFPRQEAVAAITSDEPDMESILAAVWEYILPQLDS